jgi:hypothetical protein
MSTEQNQGAAGATEFDKLMGELGSLQKALPTIEPETDPAAADPAASTTAGATDLVDDKTQAADAEPMAKSLKVTLADGSEAEAFDAGEMLKSFTTRLDAVDANLLKALGPIAGLLKAQNETIVNLATMVKSLGKQGAGRKTVVTLVEKPAAGATSTLTKSDPAGEGMTPEDFMTKAMSMCEAGKLSGNDVALAESSINSGKPIPPSIVTRVMGSK